MEYEKECTTKTKKFIKITGYEDTDCKEIEVCKHGNNHRFPVADFTSIILVVHSYHRHFFHKRDADHGYECEKEMKTVCKKKPVKEEVEKEFEYCVPKPSKVCEEKEVKIPTVICEDKEVEKDI